MRIFCESIPNSFGKQVSSATSYLVREPAQVHLRSVSRPHKAPSAGTHLHAIRWKLSGLSTRAQ